MSAQKHNSDIWKGSLFIIMAACCYGMLGTFVKLAYQDGYGTAEVTISQFSIGFIVLLILTVFSKKATLFVNEKAVNKSRKSYIKLIISGTSLGFTSIFYYMAVRYIPVSLGIVLLIQAVWMSLVLEMLQKRKRPEIYKITAVCIIIFGTILATDVLHQYNQINWKGVGWGILAAISYTATMYSSNHIEVGFPTLKRSFLMVSGGLITVLLTFCVSLVNGFSFEIFFNWGILIALFGTILPPIFFSKGMPLIGIGLGAIFTSLEIPVSILFAHFLLDEYVSFSQWIGVCLVLVAAMLKNRNT
ncbi:DMT family transporter [Flavobacterium sp. LC2016-01]|uniref:EamA family transporter n=1 Tax=Flavobacterium sp. LC2016-01 TaxID=2675876 RepID=UPI0012BA7FE7|nr:DMT family transporter [Flavobacterium sp. LC2016-01]MTH17630.1 EamA family transporter [Flavobacterium sp. LC2016-01]